MTRKEFINSLYKELHHYFSSKDSKAIIMDYEEYFDAGITEGKSEDELCRQCGEPKKLAMEIIGDTKAIKIRKILSSKIIKSLDKVIYHSKAIIYLLLIPLLVGVIKWFVDSGWYYWKYPDMLWNFESNLVKYNNIITEKIGPSLAANTWFMIFGSTTVIMLLIVLSLRQKTYRYLYLIAIFAGIIISMNNVRYALGQLASKERALGLILNAMKPFFIGIILSAILFIIINIRKPRVI